jgi:hypothetical protein
LRFIRTVAVSVKTFFLPLLENLIAKKKSLETWCFSRG